MVLPPLAEPYSCVEALSQTQRDNDQRMASLDKSRIPTGILYDRVAGLAGLELFNISGTTGVLDCSSTNHFLQAYYEMHAANYNNPGTEPCRQLLRDNALVNSNNGTVLMGALRYRFNYIDSNAVRNNQLYFPGGRDGLVIDGVGTGSPYLLRDVVVGAALVDTLQTGSATFKLDPGYIFTNTGVALASVSVNFGNGQPIQTFTPGQSMSVRYLSAGLKKLTFTFTYASGQRFTTKSGFYVKRAACANCRSTAGVEVDKCVAADLVATRSFRGIAGQAKISYFYSTTPLKSCGTGLINVTKPVVLIDGFDHDGKRDAKKLYNESLSYTDAGGQQLNFGEELRAQGYDVVVMDMPNVTGPPITVRVGVVAYTYTPILRRSGSDYIERNGLALVSLIEELNRQVAAAGSTEELVIVGPSMGGQIARYALAYMEQNGIPHRTRLYVALDSPHNGANIPIGLQRFIRHYADDVKDSKLLNVLESIDSPASREMTAQHYNFNNNNDATTAFAPHPDRNAFLATLNVLRPGGFPSNVRRVAVTNGALNGAAQKDQTGRAIADGTQAFLLQQEGVPPGGLVGFAVRSTPIIGLIGRATTTASARVYFSSGWGNTGRTMRTYKLNQGERLYDATGPAGSCGLDAGPGGYRKFFAEVAEGGWSSGLFQARYFWSVRERASFIPMLSALGCTYPGYNNCTGVDTRYLVCNNGTPFDAYYGPATVNEEHTQLTSGNVAFLKNEILKVTPKPVLAAAPPAELCSVSGAFTASLAVVPECLLAGRTQPATTYTWRVNVPGVNFVNGTLLGTTLITGSSVQIRADLNADAVAQVQVMATRAGYDPSTPILFSIQVSPSSRFVLDYVAPNAYAHDGIVPAYENVTFGPDLLNYDISSIRWYVNNSATPFLGSTGLPVSGAIFTTNVGAGVRAIAPALNTFTVRAEGTSLCDGHRESQTLQLRLGTGPNNNPNRLATGGSGLQTYPNPVQNVVSISVEKPAGGATTTAPSDVQLYDAYGHLVHRVQVGGTQFTLDTHNLPEGLYNLVVVRGAQVLRKHIEISH